MKISLEWLKEFVEVSWKPKELAYRLTMAGLEVEAVSGDLLTLGVTPNRGDCLGLFGIAREVNALQGKPLKENGIKPPKGSGYIKDFVNVQVMDSKGCPRYMARGVRGVTVQPSPKWLQNRLEAAGVRPINNVVDCTNYVMLEYGHPLHAFDHRFLRKRAIIVRSEKERTRFKTLDGVTQICEPEDLFICDGEGPVALAGIMGGANSEVREDTTDLVLEAATFQPARINRTAKRLKISSESSYRFERGVDPNGVERALHRLIALMIATAGGTPTRDWVDCYPKKKNPKSILLPFSEIKRILGMTVSLSGAKKIFTALGFRPKPIGKGLKVRVPTFRFDISEPIDLIEEIARIRGYDAVPSTLPKMTMNLPRQPEARCAESITVDTLIGLGFQETKHLTFSSLEAAQYFDEKEERIVFVENPLSEEENSLRPTLMPSLLNAAAFNLHRQRSDLKLFELGKVFHFENGKIVECRRLGAVMTGCQWGRGWQMKPKPADFFSLKGVLTQLCCELHIDDLEHIPDAVSSFLIPSAAGGLFWQGQKIGWLGRLSEPVLQKWEIEEDLFALELNWEPLRAASKEVRLTFHKPSKFPFVERDIALIVDQTLPAKRIVESIRREKHPWIQKVQLFDLFKGKALPPDKKSLGFNIRYASHDRTLTNEEVNEAHQEMISRLERELSAQLRK